MAGEGLWNPRVLVGVIPDGNTNASLDVLASSDDCLVILLLLREEGRRSRKGHPDVELGDSHLDTESGESFDVLLDVTRKSADNEVTLETDTIEGNVGSLELLDEVLESGRFGTGTLDVVIVDVEFGIRVGLSGCLEGDRDVVCAEGVVEDVCTEGTVIVEGLYMDSLCVGNCSWTNALNKHTVYNIPTV